MTRAESFEEMLYELVDRDETKYTKVHVDDLEMTSFTFNVDVEDVIPYTVLVNIFDDNVTIGMAVTKTINTRDKTYTCFEILPKINELNMEYTYTTFFLSDDMLFVKMDLEFLEDDEDELMLFNLKELVDVAKEEFPRFDYKIGFVIGGN
jgi:hypothetical protein